MFRPGSRSLACIATHGVLFAIPVILICSACAIAGGGKRAGGEPPDRAIESSAQAFTDAFNRGDAKAVAALWTRDGILVDEQGQILQGRKAIEDQYTALFKQYPGARIGIDVASIEFPTPTVAVERGFSQATAKLGESPTASRYTAVHVRQWGKWRMERVNEAPAEIPQKTSRLMDLQWLIGNWGTQAGDARVQSHIEWLADKRFIQRTYTVQTDGATSSSGIQIIGWDPQSGRIRSWSFDSSGGHGTGFWMPTPDGWRIDQVGTLADGTPTSSRDFLIRVPGEDKVLGWCSVERQAGSAMLPDIPEVVLDRMPDQQ
jgi:uncharacterized protein (TIGR02246 family)